MKSLPLACCAAVVAAETIGDLSFTSIGKFSIENPSFIDIAQWTDFYSTSDPFLYSTSGVTSLSGEPGTLTIVEGLKEAVAAGDVSTLKATVLDTGDSLVAPFIPMLAPATAFEANRVLAVPTLGYAEGGIYLVHLSSDDMT